MKVSNINSYSPSFGKITPAAAVYALAQAKDSRLQTFHVKRLIQKQAKNPYFNIGLIEFPSPGPYSRLLYALFDSSTNTIRDMYDNIDFACSWAKYFGKEVKREAKNFERFRKNAFKILG